MATPALEAIARKKIAGLTDVVSILLSNFIFTSSVASHCRIMGPMGKLEFMQRNMWTWGDAFLSDHAFSLFNWLDAFFNK